MKLLVLNGPPDPRPGFNPSYRGTNRAHPSHCDSLSDTHEINQRFFWFLKEGGELGVVGDPEKAKRFCEILNGCSAEEHNFEVIEVTDETQQAKGGKFLGFDLSSGYNNSLLTSGLTIATLNELPSPITELCDLIFRHYSPQLNPHGLFQTIKTASQCLRSITALQALSPNIFEGGSLGDFQPVGVYTFSDGTAET